MVCGVLPPDTGIVAGATIFGRRRMPLRSNGKIGKLPIIGLVAAAFALGACGGGGGGEGGGEGNGGGESEGMEMTLGTLLPLTGDLAAVGPSMQNGATLAVDQVNECGALTINQVDEDDATDPNVTAQAADKLINTDEASAIVGAAASAASFAIVDPAAQNSVVQISPSSTSPDFTDYEDNGYFFRTVPSDNLQAVAISDIAQEEGYETVNVIALNDDYGQGIAETFESVFEGEVGANVAYNPQGTNFNSEAGQVAEGDPDAILFVGFPETGTSIMQSFAEQGTLGEIPILLTDGLATEEFPPLLAEAGIEATDVSGTRPFAEGAGTDAYTTAYGEQFDGEEPGIFSANTYDAVMLAALAASAAGDTTGQAIQENLTDVSEGGAEITGENICDGLEQAAAGEDVNYEGAAGSQNFDENGDVTSDYELLEVEGEELNQVEVIPAPEPATN
jgi:branched-chain amino acid transport system substrate-binding protein/neutral amino acid transport system substrate-binding protein